jgi:hypothetical protein
MEAVRTKAPTRALTASSVAAQAQIVRRTTEDTEILTTMEFDNKARSLLHDYRPGYERFVHLGVGCAREAFQSAQHGLQMEMARSGLCENSHLQQIIEAFHLKAWNPF